MAIKFTFQDLLLKSPLAIKLTWAGILQIRELSSEENSLRLKYRVAARIYESSEFNEGVKALLIIKDISPM
ncbi:MAG: hypothetical protein TECD_00952 [Hyphomicrobiaceae bacterium hypho_1]